MNEGNITVAFLGLCDRALSYNCGDPFEWAFDVAGLRRLILSPIFPFSLRGYCFAFAIYHPNPSEAFRLSVFSSDEKELLSWVVTARESPVSYPIEVTHDSPLWEILFLPVPESPMVAKPGRIKVAVSRSDRTLQLAI